MGDVAKPQINTEFTVFCRLVPILESAHDGALLTSSLRSILEALISKTAVSTSWPAWGVKVHLKLAQLAKYCMGTLRSRRFQFSPGVRQ
jgi:hypothetical protein